MDELEKYFKYLQSKGADVPDNVDSFRKTLQDEGSSRKYYDYLKKEGFDAPPSYESFSNTLGLKKKVPSIDAGNVAQPNPYQEALGAIDVSKPLGGFDQLGGVKQANPEQTINPSIEGKDLGVPIVGTPGDPLGIGQTVLKQIASGVSDQIPKAAAQAAEVGVSAMQPANMDEYIKREKHIPFQKYVRERDPEFQGDGGFIDKAKGIFTPFDIDKHLPKYRDQFIKDEGLSDVQERIDKKHPEIVKRRLELEKYVQEQNKQSEEKLTGVPQSYKQVKSVPQAIQYAANLAAQGVWQIPLVLATKGISGAAMEAAEVYDNQVDAIAEKNGISREEVIKQNLDKPAEGQIYALAAAGLDYASAGGLLNIIKKGGSSALKKLLAVTTETLTEPAQGTFEKMGGVAGAGGDVADEFVKSWTVNLSNRIDEALGGLVGSAGPTLLSNTTENNEPITPEAIAGAEQNNVQSNEKGNEGRQGRQKGLLTPPETGAELSAPVTQNQELLINTQENVQEQIPSEVSVQPAPGDSQTLEQGVPQPKSEETPPTQEEGEQVGNDKEKVKTSGIKKALVPDEKVESTPIEKRTHEQVLAKGKEEVESGAMNPKSIVDEIVNRGARALQPNEVAGLVYYKAKLDNNFDDINKRLSESIESGDKEAELNIRAESDAAMKDIEDYQEMSLKTAYEQSLAFGLRKMLLDSEYSLQSEVAKYKSVNNGEIPKDVEDKFRDLDQKLKEANKKIEEYEKDKRHRAASDAVGDIQESVSRERKSGKSPKRGKDLIAEGVDELAQSLGIIKMAHGTNNISAVRALEKIGKGLLDEGLATVDDLKEKIKTYVKDKFGEGHNVDQYLDDVIEGVKSNILRPEMVDGKLVIPSKLIRELVADGTTHVEELTRKIHDMIKDEMPDVTHRQVRDAITKYGETVNLNPDDIDKAIRKLKKIGVKLSQLEDVRSGKVPLRTGLQREKPSDEERRLSIEINNLMKDLPISVESSEANLSRAQEAIKTRLKNEISDLDKQIDERKRKSPRTELEYDEEAIKLLAIRDEKKKRLDELVPIVKNVDEIKSLISAAERSYDKYNDQYEELTRTGKYTHKGKKQIVPTKDLLDVRAKRNAKKEAVISLKKELGIFQKEKLENDKKLIKLSISELNRRRRDGDYTTNKRVKPETDKQYEDLLTERDRVKFEFQKEQEKNVLNQRSATAKVWDFFIDTLGLPKSLLSTADFSAVLRQGFILTVANPDIAFKIKVENGNVKFTGAFWQMFNQAFNEKKYEDFIFKLKSSDMYPLMRDSKLYISDQNSKLSAGEEEFVPSAMLKKVPVVKQISGVSERAYSAYLNMMRIEAFAKGVDQLRESGRTFKKDPESYKQWANFINNASGRGNLGKLEGSAKYLNIAFFSPRYLVSRFNLLNPSTYLKMDPVVRKMALKTMGSYIGFGIIVLVLAKAAGADVEDDPRSSDFGKIKIGDTRYDIWGGYAPLVRMLVQAVTAEKKNIHTGRIQEITGDNKALNHLKPVGSFLRNKLAPLPGSVYNLASGEDNFGQYVFWDEEWKKLVLPLIISDMRDIYKEQGIEGVGKTLPFAMFGVGVNDYGTRQENYKNKIENKMKFLKRKYGKD